MIKKSSKLILLVVAIGIFVFGLLFQEFLHSQGVGYSWLITIVLMGFLGYMFDKKLRK